MAILTWLLPSFGTFMAVIIVALIGALAAYLVTRPFSWLDAYAQRKVTAATGDPVDKMPRAPAGLRPTMEKNATGEALHALRVDMAKELARLMLKEPDPPSKQEALPCIKAFLSLNRLALIKPGDHEELALASREISKALRLEPPGVVADALDHLPGKIPPGWHHNFS